jgi:hypothetical protein
MRQNRTLLLILLLLSNAVSSFPDSFTWTPPIGFGDRYWNDANNWKPNPPPAVPGLFDIAVVSGLNAGGLLQKQPIVRADAEVGSLNLIAGGQIELRAGSMFVAESSRFHGYADYINAGSQAQAAAVFGTNSLILRAEENLFGRWVHIACNVENSGYAVVENIGEMRGNFRTTSWWNRLGSQLDINYPFEADLGTGTPGNNSFGSFPQIRNDMGAELHIDFATNVVTAFGQTLLIAKQEGVIRVARGFVQFLAGAEFGGHMEVERDGFVRLGRSNDIPGGTDDSVSFLPGTTITGDGAVGFAQNGRIWNFAAPMVFDVAISNKNPIVGVRVISGSAVTFNKGGLFTDSIAFETQFGDGITAFHKDFTFRTQITAHRDLHNFGSMSLRVGGIEAGVNSVVNFFNYPGARVTMETDPFGNLSFARLTEAGTTRGIFRNLPGAFFHYPCTNISETSVRDVNWDFINDGVFRLDGSGVAMRDQFVQGPLGTMQLAEGANVRLSKTTNMSGRVTGSGTLIATNLLFNGELSPHKDFDLAISAGQLQLSGSFELDANARTSIDLAGSPSALDQWDRLVVTGKVTLGGHLLIFCTNNFAPTSGEQWRVVQVHGQKLGEFADISFVNLPAGFKGVSFSDATGVTVELLKVNDPVNYSGWGSCQTFPNPATGEPSADPDADGLSNVIEYAFGTDPLLQNAKPFTLTTGEVDGVTHAILRFTRPAGPARPGDIRWRYETSTDLTSWTPLVGAEIIGPITANNTESVEVQLPATGTQGYLRLAIDVTP